MLLLDLEACIIDLDSFTEFTIEFIFFSIFLDSDKFILEFSMFDLKLGKALTEDLYLPDEPI